ncbi:glycosyltransferase family A protein [Knoellia subterranea]|uniref:glycosyltransferase family 2 protein n=1 Tax=Knoellia subterranea TaxID=184882 RepID=UPI001470725F
MIIPVHNVADYLPKCLDSVLTQAVQSVEVLLIDDGSTDGSFQICDAYANRDNRVTVIHQENLGVSAARNAGLDHSKGDFVTFLDADDWWGPEFLTTTMAALAENPSAHMAMTNFTRVPGSDFNIYPLGSDLLTPTEVTHFFAGPLHTIFSTVWGKLYRSNTWVGVRFPEGMVHEDEYIMPTILSMGGAVVSPEPLYMYRQRGSSITGADESSGRLADAISAFEHQRRLFRSAGEAMAEKWAWEQALRNKLQLLAVAKAEGRDMEDVARFRTLIRSWCRDAPTGRLPRDSALLRLTAFALPDLTSRLLHQRRSRASSARRSRT